MLMPLVMLIALGVATGLRFGVPAIRRWRMGALLRGDWWSRFEREFRAYSTRPTATKVGPGARATRLAPREGREPRA